MVRSIKLYINDICNWFLKLINNSNENTINSSLSESIDLTIDSFKLFYDHDNGKSKMNLEIASINNLPFLTKTNFKELLFNIYHNGSKKNIELFSDIIYDYLDEYNINTELRLVHFLSQVGHESGELRYREEIASGRAYEGRKDLGNMRSGDGVRFKGRGIIQLTGRYNYTKFAQYVKNNKILTDPIIVALDPELCVLTAFYYWFNNKLNKYADRNDIRKLTRRINGGYNGLKDRIRLYNLATVYLKRLKVNQLQKIANIKYNQNLVEDGLYGPKTKKALQLMSNEYNLMNINNINSNIWKVLLT